jgi:hypothetical protein
MLCDELNRISENKSGDRKIWLANIIGTGAFDLKNEEYGFSRQGEIPSASARYELHIRDLAAKSNHLLFISPSFYSDLFYIYDDPYDVELPNDNQQIDSVRMTIPPGLGIEHLPAGKKIHTRFGSYASTISSDGKYVYFSRKLSFNKVSIPRDSYHEFYRFITDITSADKEMAVFRIAD